VADDPAALIPVTTEIEVLGPAPAIERLASFGTNARDDNEMMEFWLHSHRDGSAHTQKLYRRIGERFLASLVIAGVSMRTAKLEDVQRAIDSLRTKLEVAYFGGLRVTELVSLEWRMVIPRDSGEALLELVGKGGKLRQVLLPAAIAKQLLAARGDALPTDPVFPSTRKPGQPLTARATNYIIKSAAKRAGVNPAASAHWMRHAHASHAIDNGAPVTLVSATLGHADLKKTSIYAHARPGESSGRYLKLG
jgi:site-specific recombinase XerD